MTGFLPTSLDDYVGSDFSYAQLRLGVPQSICAFGENNSVIGGCWRKWQKNKKKMISLAVIGADGSFYKYCFDEQEGGEGKQAQHVLFIKQEEED